MSPTTAKNKKTNKRSYSAGHLGARALLASHGVYRYCPNVNDDPVVADADRDFPGVSSLLLDVEQVVVVDGRRTAFCANVLNSNNFVPPKLPGRANAAKPPDATVRVGFESTEGFGLSFDETDEVTTATVCLTVSNTGMADVTIDLAVLTFDLLLGTGSTRSGRFGVFRLAADGAGEEAVEECGTLPAC